MGWAAKLAERNEAVGFQARYDEEYVKGNG